MNRVLLRILLAGSLLVVSGLIGWRVLAPAELSASARTPYPPMPSSFQGVVGRLNMAPLVVDRQVRVYATKHQVRSDSPADARAVYTPRWSFRRWPQQLSAVVAKDTTVVTRWSDGELVAIDSRTGEVTWRADGPAGPGYAAHRTGAEAVWSPPGLRVAGGTVVVTQGQDLAGYAVSTGQSTWRTTVPAGCTEGFTTAGGAYVCATGAYDATSGVPLAGWPGGPYQPVGCGNSGCEALRDGAGRGWRVTSAEPLRVAALDDPGATLAAGIVVTASAEAVTGRAVDGATLWTTPETARVLGGYSDTVLLSTPDNTLMGLDARTGSLRFLFPLTYPHDKTDNTDWKPGLFNVTDGYLAIERLNSDAPDDPESPSYYLTLDTVLIVVLPSPR